MSIPIDCKKCGTMVGVVSGLGLLRSDYHFDPKGQCGHPEPERAETTKLFGLIKQIRVFYPETKTVSSWEEYAGPPSRFKLWAAIVFGTKRYPNGSYEGVTVNGKWAWWNPRIGFFGDGVQELDNLQPKVR